MKILFVCTGNSCRSQMAEGIAKVIGQGDWQVKSAGLQAHGINPLAIQVMQEISIDISQQKSTQLTADLLNWADIIITLCGHADEHCPTLPPHVRKEHWPFDDPAKATGTQAEIMDKFRTVRDQIKQTIGRFKTDQLNGTMLPRSYGLK